MSKNLMIFLGIIVLVLAVGGYYLMGKGIKNPYSSPSTTGNQTSSTPVSEVKGREIAVSATEYKFSPKTVSVKKGETITIVFKNNGALPHNFTISELGIATKTIASGESDSVTFMADKAGTFTYICSIPGHKELGLTGSLEVR